ncbi:coiled-coil domain-containing protein 130 [Lates japonicus]|uniref:Probable splicing factor YJU2B n=1 Tax=Lates japonicus TaxID=270547 RepID=A0AAD3RM92_LATJO|nr:coiled-coil domain-containing protein 130 [Lates japonicus]
MLCLHRVLLISRREKKVGTTTPGNLQVQDEIATCVNYIEMQTDPATCDYVIVAGLHLGKRADWDMAENRQILLQKEKLETDAMYKLDHGGKGQGEARENLPSVSEIQDPPVWRKKVLAEQEKDNAVRMRTNLSIPLLPEKDEDKETGSFTLGHLTPMRTNSTAKRKEISSRFVVQLLLGRCCRQSAHKLGLQGKQQWPALAPHSQLIRGRLGGRQNRTLFTLLLAPDLLRRTDSQGERIYLQARLGSPVPSLSPSSPSGGQ